MNAARARKLAEQLREARDLMNDNGAHWIKGSEHMLVDPETHTPGAHGLRYHYETHRFPEYQPAFCSIGALHEVNADTEAAVALAEVIDPERMKRFREAVRGDATREYEYQCEDGYRAHDPADLDEFVEAEIADRIGEEAEDIIVGFNDTDKTTWDDVKGAFSKAAKRLADRARKLKA